MPAVLGIDADAHIDETEDTWAYMDEGEQRHKPVSWDLSEARGFVPGDPRQHRLWLISGNARLRRFRDDKRTGTTKETRELIDIDARLRHMDALGIDVQVLFPTTFLHTCTAQPEVELATYKSYNRWIADRTAKSGGRLRWVAMPPVHSMEKVGEELRFAKDHGAIGVMKRGVECGMRPASDAYFYPLYEEAERLDLPICVHQGNGDPGFSNAGDAGQLGTLYVLSAFTALAAHSVPDKFPGLRWGFIEAGASWIPYLIKDLRAKHRRLDFSRSDYKTDLLRACRFYVTCDTEDDILGLLEFGAEDNLMLGTDYSHADQSAELEAHSIVLGMKELAPGVAAKIVRDNAKVFYGL